MKQVQTKLMALFWMQLAVPAAIYIMCEFLDIDLAVFAGASADVVFAATSVMILATLALIPVALRLFRFARVRSQLTTLKSAALNRWGTLRIVVLGDLLMLNTLLYYLFACEPAFGWLAVLCLLTMPFVYPSMDRCLSETEEQTP